MAVEATESKTVAFLLDPNCDIPFDVHFEIEDDEGNKLGTLGGHKAIMALKSPVFKAMLFGPMKENGDVVKIKGTSMFAFKTILNHIHGIKDECFFCLGTQGLSWQDEWWPWSFDVYELVRIVDLAERFNLPSLKEQIVHHAEFTFNFPKENLLEIARVAEENHVHTDLSKGLLLNCANFVISLVETPEDYNQLVKEWSEKGPEEAGIALRLLAKFDQRDLVYNMSSCEKTREVIFQLRRIDRFIHPRAGLSRIKEVLETFDDQSRYHFLKTICQKLETFDDQSPVIFSVCLSLWICQKQDAEEAARRGIALELDTIVEGDFTHGMSVQLHLDLVALSSCGSLRGTLEMFEALWTELERAIVEVKSMILTWFGDHPNIFHTEASCALAKKLSDCEDEELLGLPAYAHAILAFPDSLRFS